MPDFATRISSGMNRAFEHLQLTLVPIIFALLDANKILAITSFDGIHIGFKVGLPLSVVTVWQFVSLPSSGVAVRPGLPLDQLPVAIVTAPALLAIQAALTAGYFGSLRNALDDEPYRFIQNSRRYLVPFAVLTVLPFLILLPFAIGVLGLGSLTRSLSGAALLLIVPALVVFLVAGYLFYATPYLIVLRDTGVIDAARQSYALAIQGGPYLTYTGGFILFVLLVSPVVTGIVVNVPLVGIPLGIVGGGILGLGANFATMRFVADLDPASAVSVHWESGSDSSLE